MTIVWLAGHEPAGAAIHERNATTSSAPAHDVWAWLVRPDRWHEFYPNALRVRPMSGAWPAVELGTRSRWISFGAPVTTEVTEFDPPHRLAWSGHGLGAVGHHAWLAVPSDGGGCEIVTEETQRGRAVRVLAPAPRLAMRRLLSAGSKVQGASPSPGAGRDRRLRSDRLHRAPCGAHARARRPAPGRARARRNRSA